MKWKALLKVSPGSWLLLEPAGGGKRRYVLLTEEPMATIVGDSKGEPEMTLGILEWRPEDNGWLPTEAEPSEIVKVIGTMKPEPLRKADKRKKDQK